MSSIAMLDGLVRLGYGALCLGDAKKSIKLMYNSSETSPVAEGLAKFDGMALLQQSVLLFAVSSKCGDAPGMRKAVHGAVLVNNLADGASAAPACWNFS